MNDIRLQEAEGKSARQTNRRHSLDPITAVRGIGALVFVSMLGAGIYSGIREEKETNQLERTLPSAVAADGFILKGVLDTQSGTFDPEPQSNDLEDAQISLSVGSACVTLEPVRIEYPKTTRPDDTLDVTSYSIDLGDTDGTRITFKNREQLEALFGVQLCETRPAQLPSATNLP